MNDKKFFEQARAGLTTGIPPAETVRDRKRRINATLKEHAHLKDFVLTPNVEQARHLLGRHFVAMYHDATYSVQIFEKGYITHLIVRRHDEGRDFPWRTLQYIKTRFCGPERVGVEVFPAESKLVDDANLRHLWVYPAGHQLGFGLREHKFSEQVEGA